MDRAFGGLVDQDGLDHRADDGHSAQVRSASLVPADEAVGDFGDFWCEPIALVAHDGIDAHGDSQYFGCILGLEDFKGACVGDSHS